MTRYAASPTCSSTARSAHDVPADGIEAAMTLLGYYADLLEERKRQPADDLTSALLAAEGATDDRDDRPGDHRVPVPDGRRGQRDHDQAARQRDLPPDPPPRPASEVFGDGRT